MRIDVVSIFPEYLAPLELSLIGKARQDGLLDLKVHDLRDFTTDRHRTVDDTPYGGGAGMVMKPEPIFDAVEAAQPPRPLLLLGPGGRRFDQRLADELAGLDGFSLLCGRYEGIDERVRELGLYDEEISLGDFVLPGGESAALAVTEAVTRLVPGVIGASESLDNESFLRERLDYPHYTRPREFRGLPVPEVLVGGDHARIERWRRARALARTRERRPDLLARRPPEPGEGDG